MDFFRDTDSKEDHLSGYAALYNHEYRYTLEDEKGRSINVVERISPGAFTQELIDRSDVKATLNHDAWPVLARSKNGVGTMKLTADERGLHFDFKASGSHKDVVESVQRKDIDQCSYKYLPNKEDISIQDDGSVLREIRTYHTLHDICLATYPAYEATYVTTEKRTQEKILALIPKPIEDEKDKAKIEHDQTEMLLKIIE